MSMLRAKPILRDSQDEVPAANCEKCGGEVYSGGVRFYWNGKYICLECFQCAVRAVLRESPEQVAHEMGLEVERYG